MARMDIVGTLHQIAVRSIGDALRVLAITKADYDAFAKLIRGSQRARHGSYFDFAAAKGKPLTPQMWAIYLLTFVGNWHEATREVAAGLVARRQKYRTGSNSVPDQLLDAAAAALASLSEVTTRSFVGGRLSEEFMLSFFQLAKATEQAGNADIAYNLMTVAVDFGPEPSAMREQVVSYALGLALAANRPHQIAVCSARLASVITAAADADPRRRLEAFDCFETAFERLRLAPANIRAMAARLLLDVARKRDYLSTFMPPLYSFFPQEEQPDGLGDVPTAWNWPDRVSALPSQEWYDQERTSHAVQTWEMQFDLARLKLEPKASKASATTDWTSWRVDHPAYRRAVPHSFSFLREADFDGLLLVLTHEITHVLSLVGAVGNALNCLRVAAYHAEITMWSVTPDAGVGTLRERVAEQGHVALKEGEAAHLLRAEQGLEMTLKAQMLQDIWTPWFEGLAIFSEVAADPSLDRLRIGPVTHALRNLIDSQWELLGQGHASEKFQADFTRFATDFEARCSAAISRRGPRRLRAYLSATDVPYLAGYMALRAVVSAWRSTTQRPLTGAEAFSLLLNATRFGTTDAFPDLSLRSDLFAEAAIAKMCDWVCRLAQLDRNDIESFIGLPLEDDEHFSFTWEDGRLIKRPRGPDVKPKTFAPEAERRLRQALASLTRPEDDGRVKTASEETEFLLKEGSNILRGHSETAQFETTLAIAINRVGGLGLLGTLLPIGSTAGRFFVNIGPGDRDAFLNVQILTTEEHEEDRQPSINWISLRIDKATAERIAASYRRLAIPRLQVTRIIDLGGLVTPDPHFTGAHLLAFHYDDWFDIRGPVDAMDIIIRQSKETQGDLFKLVKARLYPEPLERSELEKVARGQLGATRTRDWIRASKAWFIGDIAFEVADWAQHVGSLAERVLDTEARRPRQRMAAQALVAALFADEALANDLVEKGFDGITEGAPDRREEIVSQLLRTAQQPSFEAAAAAAAAALAASGRPILSRGALGFDVHAAVHAAEQGG